MEKQVPNPRQSSRALPWERSLTQWHRVRSTTQQGLTSSSSVSGQQLLVVDRNESKASRQSRSQVLLGNPGNRGEFQRKHPRPKGLHRLAFPNRAAQPSRLQQWTSTAKPPSAALAASTTQRPLNPPGHLCRLGGRLNTTPAQLVGRTFWFDDQNRHLLGLTANILGWAGQLASSSAHAVRPLG